MGESRYPVSFPGKKHKNNVPDSLFRLGRLEVFLVNMRVTDDDGTQSFQADGPERSGMVMVSTY